MRDFESYYAAGSAWVARENPYTPALWRHEQPIPGVRADRYEVLPFLGFPALLPLWGAFATLGFSVAAALWAVLTIVLLLGAIWLLLRQLHARDVGSFLSVSALCICFAPLTSAFALGQAALPVFALIVMTTALFVVDPARASSAAFFTALQPNLAVTLLSQIRYRDVALVLGVVALALLVLTPLVSSLADVRAYVSELGAHAASERHALIQFTPGAIAYGFGLSDRASSAVGILSMLGAAAIWLTIMVRRWATRWWRLAITCALLPFGSPFFHEHDFVVLLIPALMCLCSARSRIWSIAASATVLVAIDWLGLAQRPDGAFQSALLAFALLGAIVAFSDQPLRLHRFAGLAALLLIPAAVIAARFPAPIWPDALPAHVTWVRSTLSATWHAELQAAHELAPHPLWASLRLMTVIGAGLLAWCSIRTARTREETASLHGT